MKIKPYRQGDLAFIPISKEEFEKESKCFDTWDEEKRAYVKQSKKGSSILRKGENGGVHAVEDISLAPVYDSRTDTIKFLDASKQGMKIVHREHGTLDLPSDYYRVVVQRENNNRFVND